MSKVQSEVSWYLTEKKTNLAFIQTQHGWDVKICTSQKRWDKHTFNTFNLKKSEKKIKRGDEMDEFERENMRLAPISNSFSYIILLSYSRWAPRSQPAKVLSSSLQSSSLSIPSSMQFQSITGLFGCPEQLHRWPCHQASAGSRDIPGSRNWTEIPIPGFLKIKSWDFSGFCKAQKTMLSKTCIGFKTTLESFGDSYNLSKSI